MEQTVFAETISLELTASVHNVLLVLDIMLHSVFVSNAAEIKYLQILFVFAESISYVLMESVINALLDLLITEKDKLVIVFVSLMKYMMVLTVFVLLALCL